MLYTCLSFYLFSIEVIPGHVRAFFLVLFWDQYWQLSGTIWDIRDQTLFRHVIDKHSTHSIISMLSSHWSFYSKEIPILKSTTLHLKVLIWNFHIVMHRLLLFMNTTIWIIVSEKRKAMKQSRKSVHIAEPKYMSICWMKFNANWARVFPLFLFGVTD